VVSGNLTVLNPSAQNPVNFTLDHTNSDTNMFGLTENTGITLSKGANVDFTQPGTYNQFNAQPGVIPAGTSVNTYFFHSEPASEDKEAPPGVFYNVTVKFDETILGGQYLNSTIVDYSKNGQVNPFVIYSTQNFTGLEINDVLIEQTDAHTINFMFHTYEALDEARIFTAIPEPASMTLAFSGLLGLGGFMWRKRGKKAAG
jgi:hypothetical protein